MVIGLDCAPPALVFDRLEAALPNLTKLRRRGAWGPLRSVAPPITVPAWACMVSGRDPGELGLYGFRNRVPGTYDLSVADGDAVQVPRVWDLAGEAGKRVAVCYVPMTSPPKPVHGVLVGGFLGSDEVNTYPAALGPTLEARFGPHRPDVDEFRTEDKQALLDALYDTTTLHFDVFGALWREEKPDFAMMVEMGTDRLHHALWTHLDPSAPEHDPSHPLVREARDYYAFVDAQVGALIEQADDDTAILVCSDHGARRMEGGVCVNEHLRRTGWLTLREEPASPRALTPDMIDWSRTKAWSTGGYYARVFFNVAGREPEGVVPAEALGDERAALARQLEALVPETRAETPEALYRAVNGLAPDLLVFFGDLRRRALGTVGGEVFADSDDRGPDGCNHDWDGVFIAAGAGVRARGPLEGLSIHDVGATALALLGVDRPGDWLGTDRAEASTK